MYLLFEEVLITEKPESPLLGDVLDWMKEEASFFPTEIQKLIHERAQGS
jgi:uncharacterized protein YcaQ